MSCKDVNRTPEEVTNILRNKGLIFEVLPDDPLGTVLERLRYVNEIMTLPEGENQKYHVFEHVVGNRVSTVMAQKSYKTRVGATEAEKEVSKPDFIKSKDAGTRIHAVLAEIMDCLYNGKGDINDIRIRASKGDYAVSSDQFKILFNLVKEIIADVEATQKSVDPSKKATIIVEQKMLDSFRDIGGALDILAVFSDKTHSRYDYKTAHSIYGKNFMDGQLFDELLSIEKIGDYELSMSEYGRILEERFGLGKSRKVRLVPIHVKLASKAYKDQTDYDTRTTKLEILQAGSSMSNFLQPIPIAGELTKYHGINQLLVDQWKRITTLQEKLKSKRLSQADRDTIEKQISSLRQAIKKTIIDGDISDILTSVDRILGIFKKQLDQPPTINGKPNKKYLSDGELEELIGELYMYSDIIENTHHYYSDLANSKDPKDQKLYAYFKSKISIVSSNTLSILAEAKRQSNQRILQSIPEEYKYLGEDNLEHIKPLKELGFFTRNFMRLSEIDHPVFKVVWKMINKSYSLMKKDLRELDEDISKKEAALRSWAKTNNISVYDALGKLIDFKTGNLVEDISKDLQKKIHKAYASPNIVEAGTILKEIYEIRDIEKYRENFESRLERIRETGLANKTPKKKLEEDIARFKRSYDLEHSVEAWANRKNRSKLKIKDSVRQQNLSEEFKYIMNTPALKDYYEMYIHYNNKFRDEILGLEDYKDLPYNFIPNIRKTMVDTVSMDKLNLAVLGREFFDSLQVRDEDVHISDLDASGNIRRTIPILFLNPLRNSNNDVDLTKKSYDLSKNLLLFGKMAYNYKYMSEMEPKVLQMRRLMADPSAEQGGTLVTDKYGRNKKGKLGTYLTKKGIDTDTYKLFEDITDFYLYGIKFKETNLGGGVVDTTKLLLKMKQYYGKSTLAFAVIPGLGALGAGKMAARFEGKKGISYNNKQMHQSHIHLNTQHKKYKALSKFFEVYAEDITQKMIEKKSSKWLSRFATTRNLMAPLRKADEFINDSILNAMALNWGLTTSGRLVRLSDPTLSKEEKEGVKTIWDLTSIDEKTGKIKIDGIDYADDKYLAFRAAVKKTSANIIGSLDPTDISRIDENLLYNIMFQFKSWMPGIVYERTGKLKWDDELQAARWGRYRAAFAEFGLDTMDDLDTAFKLKTYISKIFLPGLKNLILDLATFGVAPTIGLVGETYTDENGNQRKVRTNIARARRMYIKFMNEEENKHLIGKFTFEHFLEVKEAQMKAMLVELRTILGFFLVLSVLGAGGGDDKNREQPYYMRNWFSRFMFKNFSKAQSELTFMWNPLEFARLIRNPIPMTGLLTRFISTIMNGFDESRDLLVGENSVSDKTPTPYYLIQWVYGGGQIARFIELYKQYEKSPYAQKGF